MPNHCHSTLWQHHIHGISSIECPGHVRCMLHGQESCICHRCQKLSGVSLEDLAYALTYHAIHAGNEVVHSPLDKVQSEKAFGALMKATYGAVFDFIVTKVNESISGHGMGEEHGSASIGVLDIFGFEMFNTNNFSNRFVSTIPTRHYSSNLTSTCSSWNRMSMNVKGYCGSSSPSPIIKTCWT